MDRRQNRKAVRICKNQNVLPNVSPKEENNGGHAQNREIIVHRTKEEDDQIETKSEGEDGSLQLQEMISLINIIWVDWRVYKNIANIGSFLNLEPSCFDEVQRVILG